MLFYVKEKNMAEDYLFDFSKEGIEQATAYLNGQTDYIATNEAVYDYALSSPQVYREVTKKDVAILENAVADIQSELLTQTATEKSVEQRVGMADERISGNQSNVLDQLLKQNEQLLQKLNDLQNRSVLQHLSQDVKSAVHNGVDTMKNVAGTMANHIKEGAEKVGNFFKNALSAIKDKAKEAVSKGLSAVGVTVQFMRDRVDDVKRGCNEVCTNLQIKGKELSAKVLDVKDAWRDRQFEKAQAKLLEALEKKAENADRRVELQAEISDLRNR